MNYTRFLIGLFVCLSASGDASFGQSMGGGMGGMGDPFNASKQLEVVILLGEDYDFQTKPFVTAQEIVRAFGPDHDGIIKYGAPRLGNVSVDVSSSVPDSSSRSVVAEVSSSLTGVPLQEFKKQIRLSALRFGINEVEFITVEPETVDDLDAAEKTFVNTKPKIWLREPYINEMLLTEASGMLLQISNALEKSLAPDQRSQTLRLDLFAARKEPMQSMGMGMNDMGMSMVMGTDEMERGLDGMGMDIAKPDPARLASTIVDNQAKRVALQKRIGEIMHEILLLPEEDRGAMQSQLAEVIRADLQLENANRSLELQQLEMKLDILRRRLPYTSKQLEQTVRDRVQELLQQPGFSPPMYAPPPPSLPGKPFTSKPEVQQEGQPRPDRVERIAP